jgi:hypothetical protein
MSAVYVEEVESLMVLVIVLETFLMNVAYVAEAVSLPAIVIAQVIS